MADQGSMFPMFIRPQVDRSGLQQGEAEIAQFAENSRATILREFGKIKDVVNDALARPRNAGGSLDLGTAEFQANAKALEARAVAAREVAAAMKAAGTEDSRTLAAAQALAKSFATEASEANQLARSLDLIQAQMNRTASATELVVNGTKRGTEANHLMVNSTKSLRIASIQTGQQLQDIAISLYGGQRAGVVFAQQLPQLAFALSGLEGSANKSLATVGRFATFLSGPWGLAVGLAVGVLGQLAASLFESGDAADQSSKAHRSFTEVLQDSKTSWEEVRKAAADYADQLAKNREVSLLTLADEAKATSARLLNAAAIRQELQAQLESYQNAVANGPTGLNGQGQVGAAAGLNNASTRLRENQATIDALSKAAEEIKNKIADQAASIRSDPNQRIKTGFDVLRDQARASIRDVTELTARLADLDTQQRSAEERVRRATRGNSRNRQFGREIDSGDARRIAEGAGFQVNSATRTIAEQRVLYDRWVAQGRPRNNPTAFPDANAPHVRGNALDIQFGRGVSPESLRNAFEAEGVRLTKILRERGHFHIEWSTTGADRIQREAHQIDQFGQRAAESIARINAQFDEQPRLIDQAAQATRALDQTIADLTARKPAGFEQMIADAQTAKATIQDALVRPFADLTQESERRLQIERLLTAGRVDEANATQDIWRIEQALGPEEQLRARAAALTAQGKAEEAAILQRLIAQLPAQKQALRDQVVYERQVTEKLQRQQEITSYYLDATRSVRSELEAIFSGRGSIGNFKQIFKDLQGRYLTETLLGGPLRELDKWVKAQNDPFQQSVAALAEQTDLADTALARFTEAVQASTAGIAGGIAGAPAVPGSGTTLEQQFDQAFRRAANDNTIPAGTGPDITARGSVNALSPESYFDHMSKVVVAPLLKQLDDLLGVKFFSKFNGILSGALSGYATAGVPGAVLGGLAGIPGLGSKLKGKLGKALSGAQTGTLVAGLGNAVGIHLSETGSQVGGAIGSVAFGPVGGLVGSIAGGIIGNLFKKAPRGAVVLGNGTSSVSGNKADVRDALSSTGGSVQDSLARVAQSLGGSLGSYAVSIGKYKDEYRVSGSGSGSVGDKKYAKRNPGDIVYQGKDEAAAVRAALANAIKDGAIQGLRASSQALLQAGKDIDTQVSKVLKFEDVFKRLRQIKDPVGAAIDDLNKQFTDLQSIFKEAGASAAEYAQLEQLYGIERAKAIKDASEAMTSSLRSLLDELTVGNDALSLSDRRSAALAKYDPLRARVASGDTTAYGDFADAARSLLDIERQLYGSQGGYFSRLDEVTNLTRSTLDAQNALINGSSTAGSPFAANDNLVGAIGSQSGILQGGFSLLSGQLAAVNQNLGALIQQGTGTGGSWFIPALANF